MRKFYCLGVALLLIIGVAGAVCWLELRHRAELDKIENARFILISKQDMKLRLIDYKGNELFSASVATGINASNKEKVGDMRTPEGVFQIADIQHSSDWKHDFGDGKGEVSGAYGDFFIRLAVPGHKGIGIHGTHLPETVGTRASEGCIRMNNDDLKQLVSLIYPPVTVVITPGLEDERMNVMSTAAP